MKKKFNFFIIAFFVLLSSVSSQYSHSKKKWSIRIGANDINYYPRSYPIKFFLHKKNNSINPIFSNVELVHNINKNLGLYLEGSLGMVDNNRWKIIDGFFLKFGPGINFYFLPQYWFDPYFRLGGGYHKFNYKNKILRISGSKFYKLNKKDFFLLDGGLGINFWIVSNFGINIQSTYNHVFATHSRDYLNFCKHSMGLVFRFGGVHENYSDNYDNKEQKKIIEINKEDSYLPSIIEKKEEKEDKNILENSEYENKICCEKEDLDYDGILDKEDSCPDKFGLKKFKGCPDTDSDNIPDIEDLCPNKYGTKENKGCPDKIIFNPILFDLGKDTLSSSSLGIIDNISEIMIKKLPNSKFYINGYTDSYGKYSYNKRLSLRRANSVFEALVSKGVDPSRMEIRGLRKYAKKKSKGRYVEITIKK
ncbi:OmpA family protein [Blattabacterium sp. (Cryptocercus kyebangensis)]|uniref:OmpA family protein n=1 Tax=Blattabacterium sp. (Cryptocercus kyebangensis) TaxID=298656 RepID=UPI000D7C3EAB|nr:OmpA family protein [Blattabacterium sp. (Cryptocercus kyebangensis)]AWU43801.1 OmpA family protein [Blattabacterium sp. (Cryptocercus kyebangensis)]